MADSFDEQLELADVYAEALFTLATQVGKVDDVRRELEELVHLAEMEPGFGAFMASDAVDDDDRELSLERMFRDKLSDLVLNTLLVMNRHDRAQLLRPLLRAYVLHAERAAGQIEVQATSAVELNDQQKVEVQRLAAELSGRAPLVEYVVDADIVGGLVLRIGDLRLDNSVRRRLEQARQRLAERGAHGLPAAIREG